jgi:hypothetical protein
MTKKFLGLLVTLFMVFGLTTVSSGAAQAETGVPSVGAAVGAAAAQAIKAKPITAEVRAQWAAERAQMATDCDLYMFPAPTTVIQLNDSWHCLGTWYNRNTTTASGCLPNLTSWQDAVHPAPNGWGNATSSLVNDTDGFISVFDTNNCSGTRMFGMDPRTYYDQLPPAYNNKASSIFKTG